MVMAKISLDKVLKKAKFHENKGEFIEAKKLYQQVLQIFPKNTRAQQALTHLVEFRQKNTKNNQPLEVINKLVSLYNKGNFLTVVEEAQILIDQYPSSFFLCNILGASATEIGMIDEAIEAYKKAISIKPDYADAYNNMGVVLKQKGEYDEAIKLHKKAISLRPDYAEAYNNLGNNFKDLQKFDEALEAYEKAIYINPNYAQAYNNLGSTFRDNGKLPEALNACKKAISIKPDYALAFNNMGHILSDQGKFSEALKAFEKAILIKPDYADVYNNVGNVNKYQGDLVKAIKAYQKAIKIQPDYADAYSNMANIFLEQGKLDNAIDAYKKVISLKPIDSLAYNNLGKVLTDQGYISKAIEALKKAIMLKPDYAIAYNNLGVALEIKGNFEEAIETFKQAISLKPDYATPYVNIGKIFKDQGNLDKAIEIYKKAISLNPNSSDAYNNMGVALKFQGKFNKAVKAYRNALSIKPDNSQAHLNLGITLLNCDKLEEGLNEYEWRWKTSEFLSIKRNFRQPMWNGHTNLKDKTILLWTEQGIGDTMNWSSCLPLLTSRSKHIIFECPKKLVRLLTRSFPKIEIKTENRNLDTTRDDFDLHLPMGSLYKHFINEILENDKAKSYLTPDKDRVKHYKDRLRSFGKGPFVGLCWKSSVKDAYRLQHYPPISEWSPVFKVPNVTFINLQYTDYKNDIIKVKNEYGVTIHNFEDLDQYGEIDEVAALCGALDLVIATKTTPPMISAGVGTPTMIANWKNSSFNNILNNPQSATLEMIHKDTLEPWDKVFKSIADHLLKIKNKASYSREKLKKN